VLKEVKEAHTMVMYHIFDNITIFFQEEGRSKDLSEGQLPRGRAAEGGEEDGQLGHAPSETRRHVQK